MIDMYLVKLLTNLKIVQVTFTLMINVLELWLVNNHLEELGGLEQMIRLAPI